MKLDPKQPVLFLDYDGVLHPNAAYRTKRGVELRSEGQLFESAPVLAALLEPYPSVQIILSTSWVEMLGFNEARKRLPGRLQAHTVGATWHSKMDYQVWVELPRFSQIMRAVNRYRIAHWLAIDDNAEGWHDTMRHRLVHADSNLGLHSSSSQKELAERLEWLIKSVRVGL